MIVNCFIFVDQKLMPLSNNFNDLLYKLHVIWCFVETVK
jgi:hypothetical protein